MTYRIGKPLEPGQNPLHVFRPKPGVITVAAYRRDGSKCCGVSLLELPELSDDDWYSRVVEPCLAALNARISGWGIGPFSLQDFQEAA